MVAYRNARTALTVSQPSKGTYVFDMGYNAAGSCQFTVKDALPPGTKLEIVHGEVLNPNNTMVPSPTTPNRRTGVGRLVEHSAYIVGNSTLEVYAPQFVLYGFQYVQVSGPVSPAPEDMTCRDMTSDVAQAGHLDFGPTQVRSGAWWHLSRLSLLGKGCLCGLYLS